MPESCPLWGAASNPAELAEASWLAPDAVDVRSQRLHGEAVIFRLQAP